MTEENGRQVLMVPVSMAGVICMWLASFGLLTYSTVTDSHHAGSWGIWFVAVAATWTVVHGQVRLRQHLGEAFRLGYRAGRTERDGGRLTSLR